MNKIAGIGELWEGVLERDPLDEGFQLRVSAADGSQQILRIADVLSDYEGHGVRFTIAYTSALAAAEAVQQAGDLQSVRFADLAKS